MFIVHVYFVLFWFYMLINYFFISGCFFLLPVSIRARNLPVVQVPTLGPWCRSNDGAVVGGADPYLHRVQLPLYARHVQRGKN